VTLVIRFVWFVFVLITVTALVVAGTLSVQMLEDKYRHLRSSIDTLAVVMADASRQAVVTGDRETLRRRLARLNAMPELAYAAFYDSGGRLLVWEGRSAPGAAVRSSQVDQPTLREVLFGQGERMEVVEPVRDSAGVPLGEVRLGIALADFREHAIAFLVTVVSLVTILLILALAMGLWLISRITRPLQRLAQAATAAAEGNFDVAIEPKGPVEIRQLGEAFRRQLAWLRTYERHQRQAKVDLENEVRRRTEALNRMIGHARQLAEKAQAANEAKSRFLANVSHELRTPLNAILGFLELLTATELDSQQRHYVRLSTEAAQSLLRLIEDLLDFGRIEAGQIELKQQRFEVARLVASVVALHRHLAQVKGLSIRWRVAPDTSRWWYGDEDRIRQILSNLVHNALKFTEEGHVVIQVTEAESGWLAFEVQDTGIGLPEKARGRIFEAFTQLDDAASRSYGGTGLGLSICRQLTQAMGGRIEVESVVGEGSRFRVTLPLRKAEAPRTSSGPVSPDPQPDLHGRVLLVEDNRLNRALLAEMLKRLGCEVVAVDCADQALQRWRDEHFDLALLDCQMPGMDGYQLSRLLRSRRANVPIVAVTADVSDGSRRRCLEAGMADCLHKPVSIEALRTCLASRLKVAPPTGEKINRRTACFDHAALRQIALLEQDQAGALLPRLLHLFQEQGRQWLTVLEGNVTRGDLTSIRRAAHGFLSSCSHLGVRDLAYHLSQIENSPRTLDRKRMALLWAGYRRVCCLLGSGYGGG